MLRTVNVFPEPFHQKCGKTNEDLDEYWQTVTTRFCVNTVLPRTGFPLCIRSYVDKCENLQINLLKLI